MCNALRSLIEHTGSLTDEALPVRPGSATPDDMFAPVLGACIDLGGLFKLSDLLTGLERFNFCGF